MKITLIYPHLWGGTHSSDALQPLAIAGLAAWVPEDWTIQFFDERLEPVKVEEETDLAVFSVMTFTAKRAYHLAAEYRKRGVPVVMGGFHPTILPDEVSLYADTVVTGDLENIWPTLLEDACKARLKTRYDGAIASDPSAIRFDRTIFKGKRYAPMVPVQFSRGCRYTCDFCSIHSFYGRCLLTRPMDLVLEEVAGIKQKYLIFVDDNLFVKEEQILPFLREMRGLKKSWTCQISIDAAFNDSLLRELSLAGCSAVLVGFESMDQENLKAMGKGGNLKHRNYAEAVKRFREAGLMVCGAFVFGYDQDDESSIKRTLDFALQEKLALCHFNVLFPYPKTRVYDRLKKEGRLLYESWWTDRNYRYGGPLFHPLKMTGDQLSEACFQARVEFNRIGSIVKRCTDHRANSRNPAQYFRFMLSNLITRREIHRKQGRTLG